MKKYLIALIVGVAAIAIFAIYGLNSGPKPAPASETVVATPAPAPLPALSQGKAPKMEHKESAYTGPKRIVLDGTPVEINGKQMDLSQFVQRAEPGDIEGAIAMYRDETDPTEKINRLADLAYQPAGAKKIHTALVEALQNTDENTREAAFEAIIVYEDKAMIPALERLAQESNSDITRIKAKEAIELLNSPSYSELYFESKAKK
ncbi:HEAT repeat domain-containing protein [Cerasicoccus arenae]|nr:HEAT repeat domain-containing protein [Cerasicoccus arenae]MBK1858096.1 HEAT repeat domain-containing protein [Cerasicoccus arenae]